MSEAVPIPDHMVSRKPERKPGDFRRNSWGAPIVSHPDNPAKTAIYGRPSGFGGALENPYNLIKWKERQLLIGVGILDPEIPAERDELDRLAAACHDAAGSSIAADRGTHIHVLTEHHDRGQDWAHLVADGEALGIPAPLQRQVVEQWATFRADLGVEALAVEMAVVHDGWRLAGTLDRLDRAHRPIVTGLATIEPGQAFIGDIKTGSITLGRDGTPTYWTKYPVQLAAYRDAVPYDCDTDTRGNWPIEPHHDVAVIYHYDLASAIAGERVEWLAIPVDLSVGRQGGRIALDAKDHTKSRPFRAPIAAPTSSPSVVEQPSGGSADARQGAALPPDTSDRLKARIASLIEAGHGDVMRRCWPFRADGTPVPTFKVGGHIDSDLRLILAAVRRVEDEVSATFHADDLKPAEPKAAKPTPPPAPARPDEGGSADPAAMAALGARMAALPVESKQFIQQIARDAMAAGFSISTGQMPSVRRFEIARALIGWAGREDELFAAVAAVVDHSTLTADPDTTLGALVGSLTIEQARSLHDSLDQSVAA